MILADAHWIEVESDASWTAQSDTDSLHSSFPPASRATILRIGILLVEMPRMVRDVVGNIFGDEPDLCVVADGVEAGALVEYVERERPDVVVLWVESGSPPNLCDELLGRFPRLAVVALEDRGERASIYMMRPMRFRLAEISRTHLVTAIRRAARPVPFPASVCDGGAYVTDAGVARGRRTGSAPDAPRM